MTNIIPVNISPYPLVNKGIRIGGFKNEKECTETICRYASSGKVALWLCRASKWKLLGKDYKK